MPDVNCMFPDYIWIPSTGHLEVTETGNTFIHSGEFIEGPIQFNDIEDVKIYLKDNNIKGKLGTKLEI
tara:strand:+ start:179 stop:382 length:204 start_codon:yes stop_codon:yes gene_type:complete